MAESSLKLALCQLNSSDQWQNNLFQIEQLMEQLTEPVDVIVFPENAVHLRVSSESPDFFADDEPDVFSFFQSLADEKKCHVLVGSVPLCSEAEEQKATNSTLWFQSGQDFQEPYSKIHLFDVDVEGEKAIRESDNFVAGELPAVIEINGWKWGLSICYDLRFAELYSRYAEQRVDVLFVPAAFLVPTGKAHWHTLLRARSIESQAYTVAPAQTGEHRGGAGQSRHSFGHSLVVDPWGTDVVDLGLDGPSVRVVELERSSLEKVRQQIPMHLHRKLPAHTSK